VKIHSVGAKLFYADKWTNTTKLMFVFAVLRTCPKSVLSSHCT